MINQPRILIVDDDEGTRRTLRLIFQRKGYGVETADSVQEALEKANNGSFNAGLLDVRLPDGKGVELLGALKARHPDMEMIMVTGYASTETAMQALNEGATAYITKPLNMDEVLAEVRKILEKQRLTAEKRQAEEQIRHVNAVLDAIRSVNRLIVREQDRDHLIRRVCESLVETRGYLSAWIALWNDREELTQFVSAGLANHGSDMKEALDHGEWPACAHRAIERSKALILEGSKICAGCPLAGAHGPHNALVTPLAHGGRVYGVLIVRTLVASAPQQELSLFGEVADDIAMALHSLEMEEQSEQATRALRISEERYRQLFENSPAALWEDDFSTVKARLEELQRDGIDDLQSYFLNHPQALRECISQVRILDVNQAALRIHQAESKEELLSGLHTIFSEESYATFAEELALVGTGKKQFDLEFTIQTLGGKKRDAIVRWSAMPGHEETLSRILVAVIDITDRKRAEAEREHYIRELQLITDTIVVGSRMEDVEEMCELLAEAVHGVNENAYVSISLYDRDLDAIRLRVIKGVGEDTDRIFQTLGADPRIMTADAGEIRARNEGSRQGKLERIPDGLYGALLEKVPLDACQSVEEQLNIDCVYKVEFALGEEPQGSLTILLPEGEELQYASAIETLASHFSVLMQRRQTQKTLRESEQRFRALFERSADSMFIQDLKGNLLKVNEVACNRLGYQRDELLDMTISDIDTLEHVSEVSERIEDLRQRGHLVFETHHVRRDGTRIPVEVSSRLIEYGGRQAILSAARDISKRLEMEEQLQRQERLAAVGQLAGGIAHDFRNFLTTIILYAGIPSRKGDIDPQIENALEIITSEAQQASDLVQQILDFSGRAAMQTQPVDLVEFIEEGADILQQTIPENIRVTLKIGPTAAVVEADPTRIQQVLMNLALNARDAMPEGGDLEIGLSTMTIPSSADPPVAGMDPGEWVCLTVSDTGTGMTNRVKERIFEPFFTTKAPGEGTGLGLAQVYGIVQQHHGAVDLETELGVGSSFHVYLPTYGEDKSEEEEELLPVPEGNEEMILLVEDQENLREAGCEMLTALNYRVLTAANGDEALETLQGITVDLVITDVVMPKMGGKALMRQLMQMFPDLPTLAVTGYTMDQEMRNLMEANCVGVLHKPFDASALAQSVRQALDTR